MLWCQLSNTPIDHNHKLGINLDGIPVDKRRYLRLVGKLIYLSHTRPGIAYVVGVVSQFIHACSLRRSLGSGNEDIEIFEGYSKHGFVIL